MKRILIVGLMVLLTLASNGQGQTIGSFPGMGGGFENSTTATQSSTTVTSGTQLSSWTGSVAASLPSINTTTVRTGAKSLGWTTTSTSHLLFTPTAPSTGITNTTSYVIQFYWYKGYSGTARAFDISIGPDGTTGLGSSANTGTLGTSAVSTGWTKSTVVVSSGTSAASPRYGLVKFAFSGGSFSTSPGYIFDDFVIYPGSAIDLAAPNDPTNFTATNPTSSSLDLSWTASAGGVDGGGYVVLRYTSDPTAQPVPNDNGIYGVGNSIGAGTVAYIGTGTSFTDGSLSSNTLYYYRVYAVDKAFNYSAPQEVAGFTGTPATPVVAISSPSQVGAGSIDQASTNNVIYNFQMTVSAYFTTLSAITVPNTNGTYNASDFSNLKLWYNSTNNGPGSGATLLTTITSPTAVSPQNFSSINKVLGIGTFYFWITADVASNATVSNSITITPALAAGNFAFSGTAPTASSTATAGGTKTIIFGTAPADYFRSNATADWSLASTWQSSHDNSSWYNATAAPTSSATLATVRNTDIVTISSATAMPTTVVNSTAELRLSTSGSISSITGNVSVDGILSNYNNSTSAISSTIANLSFAANSFYNLLSTTNGQIPSATWASSSTIRITSLTSSVPQNGLTPGTYGATGYGNFYFDCPNLNRADYFKLFGDNFTSLSPITIAGNLTLGRIGTTPYIQMTSGNMTINVSGNVNHYAGYYILSSYNGTENMNVTGNMYVDATYSFGSASGYSDPNFSIAFYKSSGTGTGRLNIAGNLYMYTGYNSGTLANQTANLEQGNGSAAYLKLNGASAQTALFTTTTGSINFEVANTGGSGIGVTLQSPLTLNAEFKLTSGLLTTSSANLLSLSTTATVNVVANNTSTFSYVNGPLRRYINSNAVYLFPVGKFSGAVNRYKRINFTPVTNYAAGTNYFDAEYFYSDPPLAGSDVFLSFLTGIDKLEYWQFDRYAASSTTGKLTMAYTNPNNWRTASGAAISPCAFCNVAIVKRSTSSGAGNWDFTGTYGTYSASVPEYRYYTDAGDISTQEVTSFSPFTFGFTYNTILPVQLLGFEGKLSTTNQGLLSWTVADSRDLAGFELQYSRDGRNFSKLKDIASGAGTSYTYQHNALNGGSHFYRLLVKEKSGNSFYSNIVLLTVGKMLTQIIGLRENPVRSHLAVQVISASSQIANAQIIDGLGRKIMVVQYQLQAGQNQWQLPISAVSRGVYFLQLNTEDGVSSTLRFLKD